MGGKTNGSNERGVGETVAKESGGKDTHWSVIFWLVPRSRLK